MELGRSERLMVRPMLTSTSPGGSRRRWCAGQAQPATGLSTTDRKIAAPASGDVNSLFVWLRRAPASSLPFDMTARAVEAPRRLLHQLGTGRKMPISVWPRLAEIS